MWGRIVWVFFPSIFLFVIQYWHCSTIKTNHGLLLCPPFSDKGIHDGGKTRLKFYWIFWRTVLCRQLGTVNKIFRKSTRKNEWEWSNIFIKNVQKSIKKFVKKSVKKSVKISVKKSVKKFCQKFCQKICQKIFQRIFQKIC